MDIPLYFAYGSNLDTDQMARRCPAARPLGPARLDGYRLAFRGHSSRWDGAVATIDPAPGSAVWGALYRMTPEAWACLDRCEGPAYAHLDVTVAAGDGGGRPLPARTYRREPPGPPGAPSEAYRDQILRAAERWRLPAAYVDRVRALAAGPPPPDPPDPPV